MGDPFLTPLSVTVDAVRAATWVSRLAVIVLAAGLLFGAVFAGIAPRVWGIANSWEGRPITLPEFRQLARPSRAVDTNGTTIAIFQRQNSKPIELADIPDTVVNAFLAVEDREFFEHNGVNARALFRATVSNVAADTNQQGASTITMQVAKNEYLGGFDRDLRYKMLQIHYALMLERQYTKDEILQRYLNTVFFGNNAYGIEAAAETYFGLHAKDLTPVQAGFLAGLVQSPSSYDPIDNPERSRGRFEQVLGQLVEEGIITQAESDGYQDQDSPTAFQIPARVQSFPEEQPPDRSYFSEALTDYLLNRSNILGDSYDERFSALYRGGLTIQTTLNPTYQAYAETASALLPPNDQGFEAAMVSLDSGTGAVRAMVGGRGFEEDRQVNMALRPRQTGSSVKIFILAAALQAGAQANDILDGRRPCVLPNPGQPNEPFEITDAVSRDPDTLAEMTWRSINCAYARLAQIVGLNRVVDTTYRMAESPYLNRNLDPGVRTPLQPYPALATGANEMSPLDMASGAQTIANNGLHMQPYYVEKITDSTGAVVYQHSDPGVQVLDQGVALEAVDILKGVLTVGTGRHYPISVPAAGKTGTQDENTNAWFVGFTPNLTTAVWVGDPDGHTSMVGVPEFDADRVQGGGYPTEIWQNYMEAASQTEGAADWAAPPGPARDAARLFLPGNECVRVITGYSGGQPVAPAAPAQPGGFRNPEVPPTTVPAAPPATPAPPVQTTPVQPIYDTVPAGTTIPPDNLDPNSPLPSFPVANGYVYGPC